MRRRVEAMEALAPQKLPRVGFRPCPHVSPVVAAARRRGASLPSPLDLSLYTHLRPFSASPPEARDGDRHTGTESL